MTGVTSTATMTGPTGATAPTLRGLLRSEWRRAMSRRGTRWLVGLALLAIAVVAGVVWATSAPATQADLDAAAQRFLAEQQVFYEQCMSDPGIPAAEKEMACWLPTEEDARANAFWMLDRAPFTEESMVALLSFAGGLATLVCVLLAASAGGADWGARTMGLLLSWEPRRLRVLVARLGVTVVVALVVAGLVVGLALAAAALVAGSRGVDLGAAPESAAYRAADLAAGRELALRWVPIGVLAAVGSYGVAMAARSTGWAIGGSIGFVVVVESIVQGTWAWGSQWLVQTNLVAWMQGGMPWVVDRRAYEVGTGPGAFTQGGAGDPALQAGQIWLSQERALATLAAMGLAALVVAAVLLVRRDVD